LEEAKPSAPNNDSDNINAKGVSKGEAPSWVPTRAINSKKGVSKRGGALLLKTPPLHSWRGGV
jgi:hypothetical protein